MAAAFGVFLAFSLLLRGTLGELVCEDLPLGMCSFSIATSGKRCTLETSAFGGSFLLQCKTSEVMVINSMREHVETDECINACGVDKNAIGISSDSLLEPQFTAKLCSDTCYNNCPNIVDLYYNLALAEGVFLPEMCNAQKINIRRAMSQIRSSGFTSGGQASSSGANAPTSGAPAGRVLAESYYASAPAATVDEKYSGGYNEASAPAPI